MSVCVGSLLLIAAWGVIASERGPIIELPLNYNRKSPWEHLAPLGLAKLTKTDCQRPCITGELPRVCLYTLVLEFYSTMSAACGQCSNGSLSDCFRPQCIPADGFERGVMSVNRMIPGPVIQVCMSDLLVVNVINRMEGTATTIHWHGILQQSSQWMDGVPYLTQCPIAGQKFRYVIPTEHAGTFFYHSHMGLQRTNGIYGPLLVRKPRSEEFWYTNVYDFDLSEHIMVIADWMHYTAEMFYPGLPTLPPGITPSTLLINGVGRYLNGSDSDSSFKQSHPLATFHVKRNQRYRFRIINANSLVCPILIQIEDHNMTVITTDGEPIEPVVVDSLICYAGERFDVVIHTHSTACNKKTAFWIHYQGLGVCKEFYKLDQYAILSYDSKIDDLEIVPEGVRPTMSNPMPIKTILNHPNTTCGVSRNKLCVSDLKSLGHDKYIDVMTSKPDVRLSIPFDFHQYPDVRSFFREGNYQTFMTLGRQLLRSAMINNITFKFPSTPSLFLRDTANPELCSQGNLPAECKLNLADSKTPYCECPHFIVIQENSIVELTLIDGVSAIGGVNHPFHLHGYSFYVMCVGQNLTESALCGDKKSKEIRLEHAKQSSRRSSLMPAAKDTISIPAKGFVTLRWKANNPGDWLLHCHFEWHALVGMMMAFRVLGNVVPKPPAFPTCGNFDPLHVARNEYQSIEQYKAILGYRN